MPDRDACPGLSVKTDGPFFVLPPKNPLSSRQREVLTLKACGLTEAGVAYVLAISARTVGYHLQVIRERLGAMDTTHAVAIAVARRYIEIDAFLAG